MASVSLRNRAILAVVPVLVFALGLVGMAVNEANYRGAVSAMRDRMESAVYTVLAEMEPDGAGGFTIEEGFADPLLQQPGSGLYVLVRSQSGQWQSPSALGKPLPEVASLGAGLTAFQEAQPPDDFFIFQYGLSWQQEDGEIMPFTVSVLVEAKELGSRTSAFRQGLWMSLALAGAILVAAQILILLLVFRPLGKVAQDVQRIESGRAEKLEDDYPRELEPLARNLNRLLETEKSNQARIRNALDSLAHSLKTPLAVIQAGLPLHGGDAEASMQNAVDEMKRLVATRLERAGRSGRRALAAPVAVAPQVERVLTSLRKVHSHKMIEAGHTLEPGLQFFGEERDLLELLGNLLDNAFKYGEARVQISGGAEPASGPRPGLWLRVEDDGPGIDEHRREKLLQRGVRGDERVEGHGLGLALVLELVTAYGGEISIGHSELGGAAVEISIPPG